MPVETAPETKTPAAPPEQVGFNPSNFREPLPYETAGDDGSPPEAPVAPEVTGPVALPEAASFREEAIADGSGAAPTPPGTRIEVVDAPDSSDTDELSPELQERYNDYAVGVRAHGIEAPSSAEWMRVHKPAEATPELGFSVGPDAVAEEPASGAPEPKIPPIAPEAAVVAEMTPLSAPEAPGELPKAPPEEPAVEAPPVEPAAEAGAEAPRIPMIIPEAPKGRLGRLLEKVNEIPAVRRVVGKLEIAFNQYDIDGYQEQSAKLSTELAIFDARLEGYNVAIITIQEEVASLRQQSLPGAESLELRIQKIERQRAELLTGRDKVQTKLEKADNGAKYWTSERDRVANELINFYDERLQPMEKELERLESCRDQVDLREAVSEAVIRERLARVEELNNRKTRVAEAMHMGGSKEKEIARTTAVFDETIASEYEEIRREKDDIAASKAKIDQQVFDVDGRANPYRDNREEFVRLKNIRPLDLKLEPRTRSAEFSGEDRPSGHGRAEATARAATPGAEAGPTGPDGISPERAETDPRPTVAEYINRWNSYVRRTAEDDPRVIDQADFLRASKRLTERTKLDEDIFKNILSKYLKLKKKSTEGINGF